MPHLSLSQTAPLRSTACAAAPSRFLGVALLLLAAGVALFVWHRSSSAAPPQDTSAGSAAAPASRATPPNDQAPADAAPGADDEPLTSAELGAQKLRAQHLVIDRIWWNREKYYGPIGLDEPLRAKMDVRLLDYLQEQGDDARQNEAYRAFRRAITDGEWAVARERIQNLGHAHVAPLQRQAAMMVDVLEMLDEEQHRRLTEDHAGLLAGPWLSARGIRGGNRRQGRN
ncbi:MAG: hypothetical protein AAGM22_00740 [Acidobacteriota bacterium]